PVVATLDDLSVEDLKRIMLEPKNAVIKQYQKLLEIEGITLQFTEDALTAIAKEALKRGTGARAIKSVIESVMLDIMFEAPSMENVEKIIMTKDVIEGRAKPEIITRESA
ncbi:MAG: ATP-dependent Clp protease ATP-binding subunit ClpX, partial [Kosmotoga sp.]|nr:ATP-dependent Clp protease ATP-binding subunit ClpX [Kosmotoga sp.]